ncbi:MAG: hypothetical protein CMO55_00320 [Verrucomicrobiales bacterium]|nr:hypothetical protein [Verrucomicrobiales bacterium]
MDGFSKGLFWDCDPATLSADTHQRFIIERVLNRGLWNDWLQLRSIYPLATIKECSLQIRNLDPKALSFCSAIFSLPKEAFRCATNQKS